MSYLPSSRLYDSDRDPERDANRERDREPRRERAVSRDERTERERAERERTERDRIERERVERPERERAERERLERERLDQESHERERNERVRAEERERLERAEREKTERERADRERLERERDEHERAERHRVARERMERAELERTVREREERELRERDEHERSERYRVAREKEDRERAELERSVRERIEREERDREENLRLERERAAREIEERELERLAAASVMPPMASHTIETPMPTARISSKSAPRPVPHSSLLGASEKEWLVAPATSLHVESSVAEPEAAAEKPVKKHTLFHKAQTVVLKQFDRVTRKPASTTTPAPVASGPAEPDVLWFAVMCLGSICMGLMIWGAYCALPRFGNVHSHLRAELLTPRLKVTSDAAPRWGHDSHPAAPTVLVPAPPVVPLHPITTPLPPHDVRHEFPPEGYHPPHHENPAPTLPALPPAMPKHDEPVVFMQANLGDSPMIRTWKKLTESTLLLAALSVAPVNPLMAQVPEKLPVDYSKDIAELTKAVKLLSDQVNGLKLDEKLAGVKTEINDKISKIKVDAPKNDNTDFLLLANRLDQVEKLLQTLVKNGVSAPAPAPQPVVNNNLDDIKTKLGNIEQAILKLQGPEKRIALSPPEAPVPAVVPAKGNANIVFVNLWNQELTIFVNDKAFPVPAGHTYARSIASGPATIEVRSPTAGVLHRANPTLRDDETFALSAR